MALDQSALLELVEMLKASDDGALMRKMLQSMLQALIEAEATEHDAALSWDLSALIDRGARPSDIAVLCATNAIAETYAVALTRHGVPAVLLQERACGGGRHEGRYVVPVQGDGVRAFLPQIDRTTLLHTGAGQLAQDEAELMRRTMYVAMTRAKDTLWTGHVCERVPV